MLGMTQDELSQMLKVKSATVNEYESNLVLPSGSIILKLVDIIGSGDLIKDSYYK
ncbi:MAG: helix-turn-helix domain-containing protein [Clostridiaceae bacterium]